MRLRLLCIGTAPGFGIEWILIGTTLDWLLRAIWVTAIFGEVVEDSAYDRVAFCRKIFMFGTALSACIMI